MPRHQTLKFSYKFKVKRFNVNLMNENQSEPKQFGALHDEKVTLTPK